MYCSSCGSAVARTLSYCNHCGAKLSNAKDHEAAKTTGASSETLVWAIVSVALGGLGIILALIAVLTGLHFGSGIVILFTVLSFLIVLGAEGILIWLLLRFRNSARERRDTAQPKEFATKELDAAHALAEPVPSVTEHTTRQFEPLYSERKAE